MAVSAAARGRRARKLTEPVGENSGRQPSVSCMAGRFMEARPGRRVVHAGTIVEGKQDTAAEKIRRLEEAGIAVAEEIEQIPALVKERL